MTAGVLLMNPKYPHNVGAAVRAASCFGAEFVYFTGRRVSLEGGKRERRLPREERMRDYKDIELRHLERPFNSPALLEWGMTPIAVEVSDTAEPLPGFQHPENAVYVFGPEDGGLDKVTRMACHRHVVIPSRHCLNLGAAVNVTLYDRLMFSGQRPRPGVAELDEDEWLMKRLEIKGGRRAD